MDHASTSPVRPEAVEAMAVALHHEISDLGRIHYKGMVARHAVEEARERLAAMVGAQGREVVFTSGVTEAIATACHRATAHDGRHHNVLSAVEHSAVRRHAGTGSTTVVDVATDALPSILQGLRALRDPRDDRR